MNSKVRIHRRWTFAVLIVLATALAMAVPGGASAHKIVGHDGMIHACYRVKAAGQTGPAGKSADAATIAALSERIDALTARVGKLEGLEA